MYIADVLYFDKDGCEAEVRVTDGKYTINCYAHPVSSVSANQTVNSIDSFMCENIVISYEKRYAIKKLTEHFAYLLTGEVVDKEIGVVRIGDLFINLDAPIPKDIENGSYVSFYVLRLDL